MTKELSTVSCESTESARSDFGRAFVGDDAVWLAWGLAGVGVAVVAASLLSFLAYRRYHLPLNSEGRYFDPATAVVYEQQGLEVLFIAAVCSWLLAFGLGRFCWRLLRKHLARPA